MGAVAWQPEGKGRGVGGCVADAPRGELGAARRLSPHRSLRRSTTGTGLTEMRGSVEMEPCDWLLAKDDVSRLRGDSGGVIRLGLLHSEWDREPGAQHNRTITTRTRQGPNLNGL